MKNKTRTIIFIFFAIIALYFIKIKFEDYNLKRVISACIMAKKQTSETFDLDKAKKFCKEEIKKKID
tara:strand:- start:744 stop:944 length:201 start_codon:yes stop_codon:yes gene_type:complete